MLYKQSKTKLRATPFKQSRFFLEHFNIAWITIFGNVSCLRGEGFTA